ncbi:HTH domain-containing protein [Chitinibacter bivalviorum]|uniref:HTH domain-containing protein n=1 Tax=Chitinibacter bivalviorum TaxID=2739434 RepID=A0A7H9BJ96_9NEIS|nr:HTH domain-containing protein [Chitinibacter bivalviorum]QLG88071.1 HTH domain-containing protein [Chitinibacter bivalviorum]
MSRAQRLLDLLQLLRQHRFPVTGAQLAAQLGISLRSLYRDIATLQAQDFTRNQPNWGYQLRFGLLQISAQDMDLIAQVMGGRLQEDCARPAQERRYPQQAVLF